MSKPFDATLKDLANHRPGDFVRMFHEVTKLPARPLNVDLSTVTTSGDVVIGLGKRLEGIVHLDFQAGPDAKKHQDMAAYNVLLHRKYGVPVRSILVLLRQQANHRNLTGRIAYEFGPGPGRMEFEYEIVRLWEWPVQQMLDGPVGTLPLSVLGRFPSGVEKIEGVQEVLERIFDRLEAEAAEEDRKRLLTSTFVLSGLLLDRKLAVEVFRGMRAMKESDTYMMILEEGIEMGLAKGYRKAILSLGKKWHGTVTAATRKKLEAVTDHPRLERILERIVEAKGWDDLLDTP